MRAFLIYISLFVGLLLFLAAATCRAGDYPCPTRSVNWQELQIRTSDSLRYYDNWLVPRMIECLMSGSGDADIPLNDAMRLLLESLADDTRVPPNTRQAAVLALHNFGETAELNRLRRLIQERTLELAAASSLAILGYVEESAPILIRYDEYMPLIVAQQPAVVEPLLRAETRHGSPYHRMKAAMFMQYFDDTEIQIQTARAVIDEFITNGIGYADSLDLGRASSIAYAKLTADEDIPRMEAGLRYPIRAVRNDALNALIRSGRSPRIKAILTEAAAGNPYEDVRTKAAKHVQH